MDKIENPSEQHELFSINPVVVLQFLTSYECERLLNFFQIGEKESGKLRGADRRLNDGPPEIIRNNTVCWMKLTEDTFWIYEKITNLINELNANKYQFDITGLQTIQLAEYTAENHQGGQFYKSHIDTCMSGWADSQRKLSLTVQLTPPENYEGGNLLLFGDKNDMVLNPSNFSKNIQQRREFGAAIIFPSFLEHEVTPVTKGTRHSLVAWMEGPNWK
ncbi:MAG TPA: 2OG-Fe(II) oxygenase [Acidobacteriota bacterium]|nr:2OG-Fe(II) oxygenase [Acidobacteriota bacterium]